jgi:ribosomal protein L4
MDYNCRPAIIKQMSNGSLNCVWSLTIDPSYFSDPTNDVVLFLYSKENRANTVGDILISQFLFYQGEKYKVIRSIDADFHISSNEIMQHGTLIITTPCLGKCVQQ